MSLADEPQLAGIHGRIRDVYADEDDRRLELLDWLDREGFGSTPFDRIPADVVARGRRELGHETSAPPRPLAVKTFTPTPPAPTPAEPDAPKETPMPCGNCGSKDHNRRTCTKATPETKAAPAKAPKPPPAPAPARGMRVAIRVETVDELLARRDELLAELEQVDVRIRAALAAKETELEKLRAAVQAATARAAAASKAA